MMRKTGLWIVAGLIAASLWVAAPQASSGKGGERGGQKGGANGDEEEIRALYDRLAGAFRAKDVNTLMQSYAPGGELFVFDGSPQGQHEGFEGYKQYYQEFFANIPGPIKKFEIQDLNIVTEGNLAYSHAVAPLAVTGPDGSKVSISLHVTDVLRRMKGKWLIIQEHISISMTSAMQNLTNSRIAANEASAVGSLRTLNTACVVYASTYGTGFPRSLSNLGTSGEASATFADLVDDALSAGVRNGYSFTYRPGGVNKGVTPTYTIQANPITPGQTGQRYFFTDQSGVIRLNATRPATVADPPVN